MTTRQIDVRRFEVIIECDTWAATAPGGQRTADVIEPPSPGTARRFARALAAEHGPQCVIAIRQTAGDRSPRLVAKLRGERLNCVQTERKVIAAMIARGRDRAEIGDRIEWARGHQLIDDALAEALHVVNGEGTSAADRSDGDHGA
jgi:hypothetical protein